MVKQELYFDNEGGIFGAMEKHELGVLVTPSTLDVANDLAARMVFPVTTVPLGFFLEDTLIAHDSGRMVKVAPGKQ